MDKFDSRIQTYSGKIIDPFDPEATPDAFVIKDIAMGLSRECRFANQCQEFYSVAEHCVHVAQYLRAIGELPHVQYLGLLHDAAEAYLGDVPAPYKNRPEYLFYREAEERLEQAIFKRFGLWPRDEAAWAKVRAVDKAIRANEVHYLYSKGYFREKYNDMPDLPGVLIQGYAPGEAYSCFNKLGALIEVDLNPCMELSL